MKALVPCLFAGGLFLAGPALSQEGETPGEDVNPELVEYCKTAECRTDLDVVLILPDGSGVQYAPALAPPVVNGDFLIIYPGEEIFIEADVGEAGPINLKHVRENTDPEKTFIFKFWQNAEGGGAPGMFLSVQNPFDKTFKYQALMILVGEDGIYETSSCGVPPGIGGFEMWQDSIIQLIIGDLKFLEATDQIICE